MSRSAAKRRERRQAVEQGASRKPPATFQPSERAAAVRAVMHETVTEQMDQMNAARRRVRSIPLHLESDLERAKRLEKRAPWLPELDALLVTSGERR